MAQTLETKDSETLAFDFERSATISVWGAIISGAMLYHWFQFLQRLFPGAATSILQLIAKVSLNQLIMSPGLNAGFFTFVIFTRQKPRLQFNADKRRALVRKLQHDLPSTIRRSCAFWGVAQTINFRMVAPAYTTLFTNAAFLIWTTYLSLVGFRSR